MFKLIIFYEILIARRRVLTKGVSADVRLSLRTMQVGGVPSGVSAIPLETFASNKDMGRVLIRRSGQTVAAGMLKFKWLIELLNDGLGVVTEINV